MRHYFIITTIIALNISSIITQPLDQDVPAEQAELARKALMLTNVSRLEIQARIFSGFFTKLAGFATNMSKSFKQQIAEQKSTKDYTPEERQAIIAALKSGTLGYTKEQTQRMIARVESGQKKEVASPWLIKRMAIQNEQAEKDVSLMTQLANQHTSLLAMITDILEQIPLTDTTLPLETYTNLIPNIIAHIDLFLERVAVALNETDINGPNQATTLMLTTLASKENWEINIIRLIRAYRQLLIETNPDVRELVTELYKEGKRINALKKTAKKKAVSAAQKKARLVKEETKKVSTGKITKEDLGPITAFLSPAGKIHVTAPSREATSQELREFAQEPEKKPTFTTVNKVHQVEITDNSTNITYTLQRPPSSSSSPIKFGELVHSYAARLREQLDPLHHFPRRIDSYIPSLAQSQQWQNTQDPGQMDTMYVIPGAIQFPEEAPYAGQRIEGQFEFTVSSTDKIMYHRFFRPKPEYLETARTLVPGEIVPKERAIESD